MINIKQYAVNQLSNEPTLDCFFPPSVAQCGAFRPYAIGNIQQDFVDRHETGEQIGPYEYKIIGETRPGSGFVEARIQVFDGAVEIVDMTISAQGTLSGSVYPNDAVSNWTMSTTWRKGYVPVTDTIYQTGGQTEPTSQQALPNGYLWADFTQVYVRPSARIVISGSGTQSVQVVDGEGFEPVYAQGEQSRIYPWHRYHPAYFGAPSQKFIAGIEFTSRPVAAFSAAGASTQAVIQTDAATSRPYPAIYQAQGINDTQNFLAAYIWNWGDGSEPETFGIPAASHEYAASGTYTVTLEVRDKYAGRHTTSQSITVTADTGRLVSVVCSPLGFTMRSRTQASPKATVIERHDGLQWETVHTDATLHRAALSQPRQQSRLYRLAQHQSAKDWRLHTSDSLGSTWSTLIATPFDSTYKFATRVAERQGVLMACGLNASNVWVARVSYDAGQTWATAPGSIGGGSKSGDLEYDQARGRFILVADNLSKWTRDVGATAWVNL